MDNKENYLFKYELQFFGKDGPGGEKTEDATTKKLKDAREDGKVAKSKELTAGIDLVILFLVLKLFMSFFYENFLNGFKIFYQIFSDVLLDSKGGMKLNTASNIMNEAVLTIIKIVLPVCIIGFVAAFLRDRKSVV